jgi:Na+-translocating ferredoxin:NAD+ oxidoreductase RnfD subunit
MSLQERVDAIFDKRVPVWLPFAGLFVMYFFIGSTIYGGKLQHNLFPTTLAASVLFWISFVVALLTSMLERYVRPKIHTNIVSVRLWVLFFAYTSPLLVEMLLGYDLSNHTFNLVMAGALAIFMLINMRISSRRLQRQRVKSIKKDKLFS